MMNANLENFSTVDRLLPMLVTMTSDPTLVLCNSWILSNEKCRRSHWKYIQIAGDVARLRRSCASFSAKNRPTHPHRTKKIHLNFSYKSHCSRAILAQNSLWKVTHGCLLVSPGANYLKVRNSCEIILVEIWKWTRKFSARAPRTGEIIPKVLWDFQLCDGYVRVEKVEEIWCDTLWIISSIDANWMC